MGERVVPDFVAFAVDALGQAAEFLCLDSDQKECSGHMFAFEDVENLGRPLWVRTVVEGHRELVLASAIARDAIRLRQALEIFTVNEAGLLVYAEFAFAVGGLRLDVQDFAFALHVNVLAGRDVFQSVGGVGFSGHVPNPPQGAVFSAESPQGEGLDAEQLGGAHLVQSRHRIEEPDIVAEVIVVFVAEVRVERVAIEINVFFGIARADPGFLHGDGFVGLSGREVAFFGLLGPVVSVVGYGCR